METCVTASRAVNPIGFYRSFPPVSTPRYHHQVKLKATKPQVREGRRFWRLTAPVSESEKIQVEESVMTEEEWSAIWRMRGKCEGVGGGIAELLECLEKEAIVGEDDGKEPTDYNRRALIFEKSARVFQALKESSCTPSL